MPKFKTGDKLILTKHSEQLKSLGWEKYDIYTIEYYIESPVSLSRGAVGFYHGFMNRYQGMNRFPIEFIEKHFTKMTKNMEILYAKDVEN